jgi:hypothetical protein
MLVVIAAIGVWGYRHYLAIQQLRGREVTLAVPAQVYGAEPINPYPHEPGAYWERAEPAARSISGERDLASPGQRAGLVITRKQLIIASMIADALDLLMIGQIPVVGWFIQVPVLAMHVAYAGNVGWAMLLELVPVAGTLPMFTIAAMSYTEKK